MKHKILKTLLLTVFMTISAAAAYAVPALPGLYRTLTLKDGKTVRAQLVGDARLHYYRADDGRIYVQNDDVFVETDLETLRRQIRLPLANKLSAARQARRNEVEDPSIFRGKKKALVILVNFKDRKFHRGNSKEVAHDAAFYEKVLNEPGFSEGNFRGSVRDYFLDQSYGKFDLSFDVVGPVDLPQRMVYYGQNGTNGRDVRAVQMVKDACDLVANQVNWADYDWNNDGEVEQVFVLYAGYGESEAGNVYPNTVWPMEAFLSYESGIGAQTYGGVTVDRFACSQELTGNAGQEPSGIGSFCHEFSHCMGFPDFYDTLYTGNFGMGNWDLLDEGSYNGVNGHKSYVPCGYTSYERMLCGWMTPVVLNSPCHVSGMKPLSEGGESYIIYNDSNPNEYYLLENRAKQGWDAGLSGQGLLILHVDYDPYVWAANIVNSTVDYTRYGRGYEHFKNTHERLTIFHADNDDDAQYSDGGGGFYQHTYGTDPYPSTYKGVYNNELSATSAPAALLYDGSDKLSVSMGKYITNIKRNADGTIDFDFMIDKLESGQDTARVRSLYLDQYAEKPQAYEAGTYNVRTNLLLTDNEWTPLWLPCKVSAAEVKAQFGAGTRIAEFQGVDIAGGYAVVKFVTGTDSIKADTPYLIKVSNGVPFTDPRLFLQKTVAASTSTASVERGGYTFVGARSAETLREGDYFLDSGAITKAGTSDVVNALHAYVRSAGSQSYNPRLSIDGVVTAIDGVRTEIPALKGVVFDLNGRVISRHWDGSQRLPRGVYIVDGKKLVVK